MSKRNRREHGRILSVETMQRGSALDVDAAAGATSITVVDGGDFDEDGGWLYIGAQVVEFTECDDDTGVITLADPLTTAAEQGDPVAVYDPLYGEVVDYQVALVQLDGEYDNPDPVEAEVAEGVEDLPEGDRGKAGESCTLKRIADDEWEITGVGGRPGKSKGIRFEADDYYVLTADDVAAGSAAFPLSHRPLIEALTAYLGGVFQAPTNYSIDYDVQTITWTLDGWEPTGAVIWVHYAYRKGVATPSVTGTVSVSQAAAYGGGGNSWLLGTFSSVDPGDLFLSVGFNTQPLGITFTTTGLGATWTQIDSGFTGDGYCSFETDKGVSPTATSGNVTVTGSAASGQAAAAVQIPGAGAAAVSTAWTTGTTSPASASITPPSGSLVVAFVMERSGVTPAPVPTGWTKQTEWVIEADYITVLTKDDPSSGTVSLSVPTTGTHWFALLEAVTP